MLMAGGIAALVIASGVTGENFEATRAENDARIADLRMQLAAAEAKPVDTDIAQKLTALTGAAAADAGKVAAAQQLFAELYRTASLQPGAGNGSPSPAMLGVVAHRRTLAALFSPTSYLVDDTEAYRWSTADSFDAGTEVDPRYAWYVRYDGQTAADPGTYTWTLETVLPDLKPPPAAVPTDSARVVWLCRDRATGQVLAWATGHYRHDGKTGVFDELEVVVTTAGTQHRLAAVTRGGRNGGNR
ncbi:hypothetical protein ACFRAU_07145 [Arthrobacter sp. NPDC056691]|uniref:hypothetical protein n=1 Tax=Arthrobacter sp. NPDC056691 TaxID=3345913 RepID=UPI00366F9BCD